MKNSYKTAPASFTQSFEVAYRFPVHFTENLFSSKNPLLRDVIREQNTHFPKKILVIIEKEVVKHHPKLTKSIHSYCKANYKYIDLASDPLIIPGGEQCKNNSTYISKIHAHVNNLHICRHSYIMAVGGGAFLDMVGFATATAHRGVRLIRVPTTVLSQDDSGMGVKNGINAFKKKNFLGTFAVPHAIFIDFSFLKTLTDRDWRSGIAEAIKVALLKDSDFFDFIERSGKKLALRSMGHMKKVVYRSAKLHLDHIARSGDPFEFSTSRPLDFGHWAAHCLEPMSKFSLRHGEAVAIGTALDTTYSYHIGLLSKKEWQRILNVLSSIGLPFYTPELVQKNKKGEYAILRGLEEFREHLGGKLTITLLTDINKSIEVNKIDAQKMIESIQILKELHEKQK